ncbi:LPS-assembly lipoprotein [Candidatus Magnetomoraceae bacterium gMMP-15]
MNFHAGIKNSWKKKALRNKIKYKFNCTLIIIFLCIVISGCGYKFSGSRNFPDNIQTVFVEILENPSLESGIETVFTNDLIYEFISRNSPKIIEKNNADAVLSGKILSINVERISRTSSGITQEKQITMSVFLSLESKSEKILWSGNILDKEAFTVESDRLKNLNNKQRALKRLSRRMAEKVYNQIGEAF